MDKTLANACFTVEAVKSDLLAGISFQVNAGECLCISGPSGSGKSLLLRALADLDVHTGQVSLAGADSHTYKPHEWRRSVAYIPAESQWWYDTVGEHFAEDVKDMPAALGFPADVMQWQVSRLSTGEKQRLAVLRALQFKPQVLLLDEPTANMDADNTAKLEALLLGYMREHTAAIVWVSHSKEQIERIADAHLQMDQGQAA
jgi:ABC-type iron transport system FetAB ATPase subunit